MANTCLNRCCWVTRCVVLASLPVLAGAWGGCAQPDVRVELPPVAGGAEGLEVAEGVVAKQTVIDEAMMAYFRRCLAASREVTSFRANFLRQERLGGFVKVLHPVEDILAEYRDEPFSVRFTWRGDDSEYRQCVYIQGENSNMVLLMPRKGLFGLPASLQKYPAEFAVEFHKARNPITDFGPRRMMERIIDRIEKAKAHGPVLVREKPTTVVGPAKEPCRHFELRYPKGDEFPCKLQDLYIHMDTDLPVATYLWLPGKEERSTETLDGMYVYGGLDPKASITDSHFVIEEVKRSEKSTKAPKRQSAEASK